MALTAQQIEGLKMRERLDPEFFACYDCGFCLCCDCQCIRESK